jgi:hypothetical protein
MASSERAEGTTAAAATSARTPAHADADPRRRQGDQTPGPQATEIEDGLRCELLMNARYHASREAFLDTTHRILMFLIIVMGAAAIADLFPWPWVKGVFAACTVVFASFDLTSDLSNRARCHALMKRRYFELLADLTGHRRTETEIAEHMHRYSADEEPAFHALLAVSWNAAQEMVYGDVAHAYRIPRRHRVLKNIRRYSEVKYPVVHGTKLAA